jgi:AcrR family transcriptional regulator
MADTQSGTDARTRRTPVQERSRGRVQDILTATGQLLDEGGIDAVTTRALAERAGMSVAGIYQYFPNRDAIIDEYLEQATSRVDADVVEAMRLLPTVSVRGVLEAAVLAHTRFYEKNSDLVRVWLGATSDSLVMRHARERNFALGRSLRDMFFAAGFLSPDMPDYGTDLVVEVCTSAIEFAFRDERSAADREEIVQMGIDMVLSQIETFLTPRGLAGVPAEVFATSLAQAASA